LKNKAETPKEKGMIRLIITGKPYHLAVGDMHGAVAHSDTLAFTLRKTLGLTGTKIGCDQGYCGSCTVLRDGEPILSCLTLIISVIEDEQVIKKILKHLGLWQVEPRPPPKATEPTKIAEYSIDFSISQLPASDKWLYEDPVYISPS